MPNHSPKEKHDHHTLHFPEGFLWGTATSAHQVEGNNIYSDWWAWEQTHQPEDKRSGRADGQYVLYEKDFDLAKEFNHNAHRLSIEWARIEPTEGQFDQAEIDHYKRVLQALKDRDLRVMLTLWHFTLPKWVSDKGGWENSKTASYFERFVKKVAPELIDSVDLWITVNEPQVYAYVAYILGNWPPQKKSVWKAFWVTNNLAKAHKKAYIAIKQISPKAQVGISQNVVSYDPFHHHSLLEGATTFFADLINNHLIYKLTGIKYHDFLGLNYYFNQYISFNGESRLPSVVDISATRKDISDLGWEIYPEGIYDIIMDFSDYHLPIYITENGLASTNDDRRCRFLISYLKEIYHAIQTGAHVKGYFHWSLIDNFEWAEGFTPRFGLIEVDYETLVRKPRPSSYIYSEVIKNNGIPHYLLRFQGHTVTAKEVLLAKNRCPQGLCGIKHK